MTNYYLYFISFSFQIKYDNYTLQTPDKLDIYNNNYAPH